MSGSDIKESRYTKQLRDAGVTVFIGQDGANIPDGDVTVVVSTAILENNPELIEARRRNLPIVHRARCSLASGAIWTRWPWRHHGKTTTSSNARQHAGCQWATIPLSSSAALCGPMAPTPIPGRGALMWWRPTESDKSFTYLSPAAAIVTNIEADHLDHYEGLEEIYAQFAAFLSGVREDGPSSCAAMTRNWWKWPAAPGVR